MGGYGARSLYGGAKAGPLTTFFSDSLGAGDAQNGYDTSFLLVMINSTSPFSSPIGWAQWNFGINLSDGHKGAQSSLTGVGNPTYLIYTGVIPYPVVKGMYPSNQQFVQATLTSPSAPQGSGFFIMGDFDSTLYGTGGQNFNGYYLRYDASTSTGSLYRSNTGTVGLTQLLTALSLGSGNVIRLSADASKASQTVVTITKAGTVLAQYTDISANRLNQGFAGLMSDNPVQSIATPVGFHDFSCGVGL